MNYYELKNLNPFKKDLILVDSIPEFKAKNGLRTLGLKFKWIQTWGNDRFPDYCIHLIRIAKKDLTRFKEIAEQIERDMLILGKTDYPKSADAIINIIKEMEEDVSSMVQKNQPPEKIKTKIPKQIAELSREVSGGHWNTRVIKRESKYDNKELNETYYGIYEVYYNKKGEPWAYSQDPIPLYFENREEFGTVLGQILDAIEKPIFEIDENDCLRETSLKLEDISEEDGKDET